MRTLIFRHPLLERARIIRCVMQGERIPRGYGVAWVDFERNVLIALPIPLNVVARAVRWVYFEAMRAGYPSAYDRRLRDAFELGRACREAGQ